MRLELRTVNREESFRVDRVNKKSNAHNVKLKVSSKFTEIELDTTYGKNSIKWILFQKFEHYEYAW